MQSAPRLTVIVPVYNEARTLSTLIHRLHEVCGSIAQLIFVDDGSSDDSLTILRSATHHDDLVLTKPNGGKGSAIRFGLPHAQGQFTVIQDADLEYDPADAVRLLREAEARHLPVLYGSRRLYPHHRHAGWRYYIGGNLISTLVNVAYGSRLTDVMTCYKLIETGLLRSLQLRTDGFQWEVEITAQLLQRGIGIPEVPIDYHPRTKAEGKKIGGRDFLLCLATLLRARWCTLRSGGGI